MRPGLKMPKDIGWESVKVLPTMIPSLYIYLSLLCDLV